MEDPTEDIEVQEETPEETPDEIPPDPPPLVRQTNSAPEPEPEPEPAPVKKVPKKYEQTTCPKCGKSMSINTLRYKHKCCEAVPDIEEAPEPPAPKAQPKAKVSKAQPKKRVVIEEAEEEESEPPTPRSNLRNMYREVKLQQLEAKRNRYRGFFD